MLCSCLPTKTVDHLVLYESFEQHSTTRQVANVDFTTSDAEEVLLHGWSSASPSLRWSTGSSATLRLHLAEALDRELRLSCRVLDFPSPRARWIDVSLNGSPLGRREVDPTIGFNEWTFPLAAEVQQHDNVLELRYSHPARPRDVLSGSSDPRQLALGCRSLSISPLRTAVRPRSVGRDILLPHGTCLEIALPIGTAAVAGEMHHLHLEALEFESEGNALGAPPPSARLLVEGSWPVARTATGWRTLHEFRSADTNLDVALAGQPEMLRLRLVGGDHRMTARLQGARLRSPQATMGGDSDSATAKRRVAERRPNVLIYLIDTLRADALGTQTSSSETPTSPHRNTSTTPHLDRFAREATVFANAQAAASWTRSSVASILTGLDPDVHRTWNRSQALSPEAATIASHLASIDYRSLAVFTNSNASPLVGFDRDFEDVVHLEEEDRREIHQPSDEVTVQALAWLRRPDPRPFFIYLHSTDPHDPYLPLARDLVNLGLSPDPNPDFGSGPMVRRLERGEIAGSSALAARLESHYWAEVLRNDRSFGRLIDGLKSANLLEDTLIVVVSDHGEEFWDHGGWTHGRTLFQEVLHVPLIVHFPDGLGAGRRIDQVVHHTDILPTVLDLVGLTGSTDTLAASSDRSTWVAGRSLRTLLSATAPERPAFSHLDLGGDRLEALRFGRYKLLRSFDSSGRRRGVAVYDLVADPQERRPIDQTFPAQSLLLTSYLNSLLHRRAALRPQALHPAPARSTDVIERRLRALGYL